MSAKEVVCVLVALVFWSAVFGQSTVQGNIYDEVSRDPLSGVTLKVVSSGSVALSREDGSFNVLISASDTLIATHIGYAQRHVALSDSMAVVNIYMEREGQLLDAVEINTGYYRVPRERATGSFVHIDDKLLNRAMGANVLQRLEGVAPGVQFVQAGGTSANHIRIRGLSTIESDETPLIVLDNFPYEGDLDNIDPNDIESITVLRDAAAASIWGARAGNGVIVITSKRANKDSAFRVSLNANANIGERPDLYYGSNWLLSETVMEIEKERYGLGHYTVEDRSPLPMYIELLREHDEGRLEATELARREALLRNTDTRQQVMEYLYRNSGFRQLALNVAGGAGQHDYNITAGYHGGTSAIKGNDNRRVNLGVRNRFTPYEGIELGFGIAYVGQHANSNGIGIDDLSVLHVGVSPYLRLADHEGNALPVPKDIRFGYAASASGAGLLDWKYKPLEEVRLADNTTFSNELRLNGDVSFSIWDGLHAKASYQYLKGNRGSRSHHVKDSYYVRNLVNRFTQPDGLLVIPHNGILRVGAPTERYSHFGRGQIGYAKESSGIYRIDALAGLEIRHSQSETFPASVLYNYDDDYLTGTNMYNFNVSFLTLPEGSPSARIPGASAVHNLYTHRDLSYFGNVSYGYFGKYIISGSLRWDASNLFGVKTNQKGVPLWSMGGSWEVSKENFYPLRGSIHYLRVRATYGISGNVNKMVTHFPTVRYGTSIIGFPLATISSVGNPSLRWERVATLNLAMDWRAIGGRISGMAEWYRKHGSDLIGDDYMDPTTGIGGNYKINYADIQTRGVDVQVNSQNIAGRVSWTTSLMASWVRNRIENFNTNESTSISNYFYPMAPPTVGKSRDVLYAIPWHGLSQENGQPVIYMDGEVSQEFGRYYQQYLTPELLSMAGVSIPTNYGSMRNVISWNGFEVGALVTWKTGYVFRRSSMRPFGEYYQEYHEDYLRRWEKPGDELLTNVPAKIMLEQMTSSNSGTGTVYLSSEALVTRGDHLRLQEVHFNCRIPESVLRELPVRAVRLSAYMRNLGVLWRANMQGIDPDYADAAFRAPRTYSIGIQVDF